MPRFFITQNDIQEQSIIVSGENHHHMLNVLRIKLGDKMILCDGESTEYICQTESIDNNHIKFQILEMKKSVSEPKINITLFQALPKSDKMEYIVQKSVELGVYEIIQVETEFTVVKQNGKEDKKLNRLTKISESAAKQSGRGRIPIVKPVVKFKKAVEIAKEFDLVIVAYEKEKETTLKSVIKNFSGQNIAVFIGSEGGFSESEIELCKTSGFNIVTLGERILRTETASPVITSLILYELEG